MIIKAITRSILVIAIGVGLAACSEEQQNKLSRLGVTWLEGDYRITYAAGSHVKSWNVKQGKVTSEAEKGYYFFWADVNGKNVYVQTPVEQTYIEEVK